MELKDSVRVMTKEEFESAINEDIKFVEGIKHFFKHDDATRVMEHVKSVLEASVDYHYPNHPEPEAEPGDMGEVSDGYHTFNELYRYRMLCFLERGMVSSRKNGLLKKKRSILVKTVF